MHVGKFISAVAQRAPDRGVGKEQPAICRDHKDHVGHGLEEGAEIGLTFPQACFCLDPSGYIPKTQDSAYNTTVQVLRNGETLEDPAVFEEEEVAGLLERMRKEFTGPG
jgi:hypothetical protein